MDTSLDDFWGFGETHSDAAFDNDRQLFCDPVNGIAIEVLYFYQSTWPEIPSTAHVRVYRKQTLHSLKLTLPQSGVWVTVDDRAYASDENGEATAIVLSGNHTVTVHLPSSLLYANASIRWSDGETTNPRQIQVLSDTTLACFFLVEEGKIEQLTEENENLKRQLDVNHFYLTISLIAIAILAVTTLLLYRRHKRAISGKLVSDSS